MRRLGFWTLVGGSVFALLPVACTIVAGLIATVAGCQLDEAGTYPCVILGLDWGGFLGMLGMMFWLAFVTVPVGGLAALVGLVVYVTARVLKK